MTQCLDCGARISRYAPAGTRYCATHEPDHLTHDDMSGLLAPHSIGVCKRGHNLDQTGYTRNKGNGKTSRKCRVCHAIRQAAYRQRKALA